MPANRYNTRLVNHDQFTSALARQRWVERNGEGPRMTIQMGRDDYGWDNMFSLGTLQLKELHTQIGAHLAKLQMERDREHVQQAIEALNDARA